MEIPTKGELRNNHNRRGKNVQYMHWIQKYIVNERTGANKELWYHVLKPQPLFISRTHTNRSMCVCVCVQIRRAKHILQFNAYSNFSRATKALFLTITFHSMAFLSHPHTHIFAKMMFDGECEMIKLQSNSINIAYRAIWLIINLIHETFHPLDKLVQRRQTLER